MLQQNHTRNIHKIIFYHCTQEIALFNKFCISFSIACRQEFFLLICFRSTENVFYRFWINLDEIAPLWDFQQATKGICFNMLVDQSNFSVTSIYSSRKHSNRKQIWKHNGHNRKISLKNCVFMVSRPRILWIWEKSGNS